MDRNICEGSTYFRQPLLSSVISTAAIDPHLNYDMATTIFKSLPLWQKATARGFAAAPRHLKTRATTQRLKLLQSIYEPAFSHLRPGSPEYEALANSGKVWEDHFKPREMGPWLETQSKLESTLESVDKFRIFFGERPELRSSVTHSLITEWAHQSTAIEANPLSPGDAFLIAGGLESQLFSRYEGFRSISTQALSDLIFLLPAIYPLRIPPKSQSSETILSSPATSATLHLPTPERQAYHSMKSNSSPAYCYAAQTLSKQISTPGAHECLSANFVPCQSQSDRIRLRYSPITKRCPHA